MPSGFDPIINLQSKILILGTLPGTLSLERHEYYADPQNQFWDIVYSVYDLPVISNYIERCKFILNHGLALWDVLNFADREGALDSAIRNDVPNDLPKLLNDYPNIKCLIFNGSKAEKLFKKYNNKLYKTMNCARVSSSSPTPGKYVKALEEKRSEWKSAFNLILSD